MTVRASKRLRSEDQSSQDWRRRVKPTHPKCSGPDRRPTLFTREGCGYCARAKALLAVLGYDYAEIALPYAQRSRIVGAVTGETTVPQVFVNGSRIGGLEALERWALKAA